MAAAAGEENAPKLEAMSKDDHSWHPCQVSLSSHASSGSSLIVDFESCNLEDIISTEEEALARLRIRSIPLKDGECFHIKEGEHILAMHKTQFRGLFFDAEVDKIWRVRHSLRIHCRCSFDIRWLHPEMKGETMTISSSSVMKLAGNSIHSHPTVAAFLNTASSLNNSGITSHTTLIEDIDYKIDLQRLLEEQIEQISKVADASSKAVSQDILLRVKGVERAGHTCSEVFVASELSSLHDKTLYNQNNYERSTTSQRKLRLETESMDLSLFQPSSEEHFQKRSLLSPLAARAALASLMHELPQKPEISIYHVEKEGYVNTSQNTAKKHMDVSRMFMNSDICIQEKLSVVSNHSSEVASMPVTSNPIQIANDTFGEPMLESRSIVSSRRVSSEKSWLMEDFNEAATLQEKSISMPKILEDGSLNTSAVTTRFTRSVMNKKSNNTTATTRVTPAIQNEMGNATDKAKLKPLAKDIKMNSPTITKRFTRSSVQKETGHSVNEVSMASTEDRKLNSPIMTRNTRSANHKEMRQSVNEYKVESSTTDGRLNSPTITRLTSSAIQSDVGNSVSEDTLDSSTEYRKLNNPSIPSRLTRSAICKEMGNSVKEVKLKSSTKDRKLNSPTITTRLTRSAIQREIGKSEDETKVYSKTKWRKSCSPTTTTGLTCSAFQREMGSSINGVKLEAAGKAWKLNNPPVTTRVTRSVFQKEMGNLISEVNVDSLTKGITLDGPNGTRLTYSPSLKETGCSAEVELDSSTKGRKLNNTPISIRLTRSSFRRDMEDPTVKVENEWKKGKSTQDSGTRTVDLVTPKNKEPKKKRSVPSPFNAEKNLSQGKRNKV